MALLVLSLGFVPCPSSILLPCPVLSAAFVFFFPLFTLHRQSSKSQDMFLCCDEVANTGNQGLFY